MMENKHLHGELQEMVQRQQEVMSKNQDMEITIMALERELRAKNSLNYSIYNQMSQQQAGKGVQNSH